MAEIMPEIEPKMAKVVLNKFAMRSFAYDKSEKTAPAANSDKAIKKMFCVEFILIFSYLRLAQIYLFENLE